MATYNYRTPGVYVEEISMLPPSVAEVATAVPAFIGYTEKGPAENGAPVIKRIATMLEFKTGFGGPDPAKFAVTWKAGAEGQPDDIDQIVRTPPGANKAFSLYYALRHYFNNGGGPCYVVSVGNYSAAATKTAFEDGLKALEKEDEPTLIVLTDAAQLLGETDYYNVCQQALAQCKNLGDRFTIVDVVTRDSFRDKIGVNDLMYGAAYYPYLQTSLTYEYDEDEKGVTVNPPAAQAWSVKVPAAGGGIVVTYSGSSTAPTVSVKTGEAVQFAATADQLTITCPADPTGKAISDAWKGRSSPLDAKGFGVTVDRTGDQKLSAISSISLASGPGSASSGSLADIKKTLTGLYNKIKSALNTQWVNLPPSAAMAGIYARVDREQGVWKAPANVGVMAVLGPVVKVSNGEQEDLNIDPTAGKSINAIRDFTGKGTLVWGGRTLAGNDNEWRYVSVRRLFITIEESAKKASAFAVFEPNDQSTWLKVKAMIESYLYGLWEQGALAGSKPEAAYYVHVGLGTTMTPQDVLEGRMIVKIGVAAVRPAEFIILRFSHKMQTA